MKELKHAIERDFVESERMVPRMESTAPSTVVGNAARSPEALTQERGTTHGRFLDHANYTQSLKRIMYRAEAERAARNQQGLTPMQREALEMIFHKVGRILAGQSDFQDHWDDIAGYAHLPGKEW